MEKSFLACAFFCVLSAVSACVAHWRISHHCLASLCAGMAASVVFQIIGYFVLGYLDPFFIIAFMFGTVVAIAIALLVGIPFTVQRAKQHPKNRSPQVTDSTNRGKATAA
jgi:uncharacterized membrane protein YfcA